MEENPFDTEFNEYDDDYDDDDGLDFATPQNEAEVNNFAVLNSSLPDQLPEPQEYELPECPETSCFPVLVGRVRLAGCLWRTLHTTPTAR